MATDHKLAVFFDGSETPTFRMDRSDERRPPRRDMSWRIEDEATGRVVAEYHPQRSRTPVLRKPITPFFTEEPR